MSDQLESNHSWIYEVFSDLSNYASKNSMFGLLTEIERSLPTLEAEIGSTVHLTALRQLLSSLREHDPA